MQNHRLMILLCKLLQVTSQIRLTVTLTLTLTLNPKTKLRLESVHYRHLEEEQIAVIRSILCGGALAGLEAGARSDK